MSILAIEGGHRLSGSVDVEGNKNSALPLLAACLLTTEECVLTNVPRISDVEVMARLLIDLGRHGGGHRHHNASRTVSRGREGRAGRRHGRPAARLRAALRPAAGAAGPGAPGAARRRLSGAANHRHSSRSAGRDGRARRCRMQGHGAGGSGRAQARIDVPLRGVGDRNRNGGARRGGSPGRVGNPPRRVRAARGRAVRVPAAAWRRRDRRRDINDPDRRRLEASWRRIPALRRLHRSRQLGRRCRRHRRRD